MFFQLGTYGYFLYGIGPSIPLLRDEQGVSRTVGGLHGTALAAGALGAGFLSATVVRRWGRGSALWSGLALMSGGLILYTSTTAIALTLSGALVGGLGGSLVVNSSSAVLSDHHGAAGPAAVSEANALAAGLGAMAPLAVGGAEAAGLGWRTGLLVTLLLVAAVAVTLGRERVPDVRAAGHGDAASRRLPPAYWWAWGVLVLVIAVEFCLTIWASEVLRERTGMSAGAAAGSVTALVVGMAAGRFLGARLALRYRITVLLHRAVVVCTIGFGVFWLSTWPAVSLAGLLVCGLGLSLLFPLGITHAIAVSGGRADLATARGSFAAALAVGGGPFALGALADIAGAHRASLIVPVMLAMAVVGVSRSRPPEDVAAERQPT